jgi:DNA-binding MarR family transcriptional regulator
MDRVDEVIEAWRRELPDVVGPATGLCKRVTLLAAALAEASGGELRSLDLTVAEYDVLVALRRAGSPFRMKPSQLVRELLLSSGGTAKTLGELAARGLVRRSPDASDGRVSWVSLTAAGADLSECAIRATSKAQQELFARVPPDQVRAAAEALREISESQAPAGGPAVARRS